MHPRYRKMLEAWEQELRNAPRRPMLAEQGWAKDVPLSAGVYVVWDTKSRRPWYVGQTTCLRDRMGDAGRPINHTFRRHVQKQFGLLTHADIGRRCTISFLPMAIGRAELEEYLRLRWRGTIVNGVAKRLLKGPQYEWVMPDGRGHKGNGNGRSSIW